MDWDDPAARARLAYTLGPEGYNAAFEAHVRASTLETVNGYPLRPIGGRFGRLIQVYGSDRAFTTIEAARDHALTLPPRVACSKCESHNASRAK